MNPDMPSQEFQDVSRTYAFFQDFRLSRNLNILIPGLSRVCMNPDMPSHSQKMPMDTIIDDYMTNTKAAAQWLTL